MNSDFPASAPAHPPGRNAVRRKFRFGITLKMFLAVLIACLVISLSMGYAIRISFENGFLHYVRERDARRVKVLVGRLEAAYIQHGNWDFLRGHPETWNALLDAAQDEAQRRDAEMRAKSAQSKLSKPSGSGDVWQHFMGSDRVHQFFGTFSGERSPAPQWGMRLPRNVAPDAQAIVPVEPSELRGLPYSIYRLAPHPPATLFDIDKELIVSSRGRFPREGDELEPIYDGSQIVGWLAARGPDTINDAADIAFQSQQARATLQIAGVCFALAALVALLLAQVVLAPVKRLIDATHRLANGDLATRVKAGRRDELGQLAGDFNVLAHSLEAAEQSRKNFIADISHELRTPLAVLRSELEAIEDGVHAFNRDSLQSLQNEVTSLNAIVEDLYELSLSDVGALRYQKERIDLRPVASVTAEAFREAFKAKDVRLVLDLPLEGELIAIVDPGRFMQLLKNLLQNSLRYTDDGGEVHLRIDTDGRSQADEHHDDATASWRVVIEDSAPGVPLSALTQLFERLYRVDESRSRKSGGSGLGLALCKAIVVAHGGAIAAELSELGGIRITARFPFDISSTV